MMNRPATILFLISDALDHYPEGIEKTKYAEKEAELNQHNLCIVQVEDRLQMGTRMSLRLVRNPHMKNSVVTIANGPL